MAPVRYGSLGDRSLESTAVLVGLAAAALREYGDHQALEADGAKSDPNLLEGP